MIRFESPSELQRHMLAERASGKSIGFLPTMGALHEGHLSLMRQARQDNDLVVTSIFVNPAQFGPDEDFHTYPRRIEEDAGHCALLGVDVLFCPSDRDMYLPDHHTWVDVHKLSEPLCGAHRPGHFRSVATIVLKLFHLVQPTVAYFGQKDAQQAIVIRRMVRDLNVPVQIRIMPIVREEDGLAMSSRNVHLSGAERKRALSLHRALTSARDAFEQGERDAAKVTMQMRHILRQADAKVDYVAVVHAQTLESVSTLEKGVLVAIAARFGTTRLIDNCIL